MASVSAESQPENQYQWRLWRKLAAEIGGWR